MKFLAVLEIAGVSCDVVVSVSSLKELQTSTGVYTKFEKDTWPSFYSHSLHLHSLILPPHLDCALYVAHAISHIVSG